MSQTPAVSVIMNCLNCARDLPEALASVRRQTFQDLEIIFWDNGSTDQSARIAQDYGPPLRYFRGDQTVPLGAARNLAIERARGRYIAFLDCDDMWRPAKLARQVELFEQNPAVGLVCTDTEIFDGKKVLSRVFSQAMPARGKVFSALMERQWISMSSAMIRKTALDELADSPLAAQCGRWFDENLKVCEEADVFYRVAHDWELDYIDEPLTVWRVHGHNTTFREFGEFADETLKILEKHRLLYPDYDRDYADVGDILSRRAAFQKAVSLWKNGKNSQARQTIAPWLKNSTKNRLFWLASYLPGAFFNLLARLYFALPKGLKK